MNNVYKKEFTIKEKKENEINIDIIQSILYAKQELNCAHTNLKYADPELTDYYSYKIKAAKSKLDYLIKLAKSKNITVDMKNLPPIDYEKYKVI